MAKRQKALEGELVTGTDALLADDDYRAATEAAGAMTGLLTRLAGFFTTALELEKRSFGTLETARGIRTPKTALEDEGVQRFIQRTSREKREVEEHWKVTTIISGFHRRMTARRGKATDALEQANKLAQAVHNGYVENERRRVQEEERRREEVAREQARIERERELAELDRQALEREQASAELSGREQVFVERYMVTRDAVRSAQTAGYRDHVKAGERLLKTDKIRKAIVALEEAAALRKQQAAAARKPLDVAAQRVGEKPIEMQVTKATGTQERTYHYGDILDMQALLDAVLAGQHGIPTDILTINPSKVNEYAGALQDRINRWPGVRYRKETKTV